MRVSLPCQPSASHFISIQLVDRHVVLTNNREDRSSMGGARRRGLGRAGHGGMGGMGFMGGPMGLMGGMADPWR